MSEARTEAELLLSYAIRNVEGAAAELSTETIGKDSANELSEALRLIKNVHKRERIGKQSFQFAM